MAYHKHPNSYGNDVFRWYDYQNFDNDWRTYYNSNGNGPAITSVGVLMWHLGNGDNLNMDYDADDGSGAKDRRVPITLNNFGYNRSDVKDYNEGTVISNINQKRPVYVSGDNGQIIGYKGHAWVVDGSAYASDTLVQRTDYFYQGQEVGYSITKGIYGGNNYVHCNWGWEDRESADKGYYSWFMGKQFTPVGNSGTQHNFKYSVKMVVDIYPQ